MNLRICKICGKEFKIWHSKAKTCGKECSKIYGKQIKRLYKENNRDKIRKKAKQNYYKIRKLKKKVCKICGSIFYLKGNRAKTCSEKCRLENIRRNGNRGSKKWVKLNKEKRRKTCRDYYYRNIDKIKLYNKQWTSMNREKIRKQVKKWRKNNRKKRNAQAIAQYNIKIPDMLCEDCKLNKAIHRHHVDYNKPLDVRFLCAKCHSKIHNGYENG